MRKRVSFYFKRENGLIVNGLFQAAYKGCGHQNDLIDFPSVIPLNEGLTDLLRFYKSNILRRQTVFADDFEIPPCEIIPAFAANGNDQRRVFFSVGFDEL